MVKLLALLLLSQITYQNIDIILPTPAPAPYEIERLQGQISGQLAIVERMFGPFVQEPVKVKITASPAQYKKECRAIWPSGGSYLPYEDMVCLPPLDQLYQLNDLNNLLRHELTHAKTHKILAHCPYWVEEYFTLLAGSYQPINCPAVTTHCPTNRELTNPQNHKAANLAYCQTYLCGKQFISSQKPHDVANMCQNFAEGGNSESLGHK